MMPSGVSKLLVRAGLPHKMQKRSLLQRLTRLFQFLVRHRFRRSSFSSAIMPSGVSKLLVRAGLTDNGSTDLECSAAKRRRIGSDTADCTPISKLGDDLLEEILIRLPNPRSACRCKPVCKRWNSMLSDPSFNRRFLSHHKSRTEALGEPPLLLPSDDPLSSVLSFLPVPEEIRSKFVIWDCFKDLLLCGFHDRGESGRLFLICNPFTKQWVTLPLSPAMFNSYETPVVKLVCKEARNNNSHSLDLGDGQVFLVSDYRFRILLEYPVTGGRSELHVFCSRSRQWSRRNGIGLQPDAIFLNRKLYTTTLEYDPFRLNILPTFINIFKPEVFWRYLGSSLSASHGALYLSTIDQQIVFRVWRWEEGSRTWMKYHDSGLEVGDLIIDSVLAQHVEEPEVFFFKCFRNRECIVCSYDFRMGKLECVANKIRKDVSNRWTVFQPRISCFPTPIPSYDKLLGMYKGSYRGLVSEEKTQLDF